MAAVPDYIDRLKKSAAPQLLRDMGADEIVVGALLANFAGLVQWHKQLDKETKTELDRDYAKATLKLRKWAKECERTRDLANRTLLEIATVDKDNYLLRCSPNKFSNRPTIAQLLTDFADMMDEHKPSWFMVLPRRISLFSFVLYNVFYEICWRLKPERRPVKIAVTIANAMLNTRKAANTYQHDRILGQIMPKKRYWRE